MHLKQESFLYKLYQKFSSIKFDVYETMIFTPSAFRAMSKSSSNIIGEKLTPIEFKNRLVSNLDEYITKNYCQDENIISITLLNVKENYIAIEVTQKWSEANFLELLNTEDEVVNDEEFNKQFCSEYLKTLYPDNNELNSILDKL